MSEIKPVYQIDVAKTGAWSECTSEQFKRIKSGGSELVDFRILYPAAAYEAQAKRIAELEEHVTKLGSGSRQHLYQALARRYKEILSLRRENEALRNIKEAAENLFSHKNNYHNEQKAIALTNALAKLKNGDNK